MKKAYWGIAAFLLGAVVALSTKAQAAEEYSTRVTVVMYVLLCTEPASEGFIMRKLTSQQEQIMEMWAKGLLIKSSRPGILVNAVSFWGSWKMGSLGFGPQPGDEFFAVPRGALLADDRKNLFTRHGIHAILSGIFSRF